jgi:hypothetical protein
MDFLKKHYEKLILCVVLLGLAGAVLWMKSATNIIVPGISAAAPPRTPPPPPLDLTNDQEALAQITNPPPVVLSGDHNLFNPVTWKRKPNGDLLKVIKTGPDALAVTKITPLYMIITYEGPMEGLLYVMGLQREIDLQHASNKIKKEYLRKDEKKKGLPFIVRGTKGAENDPSEINLEMAESGDTNVWVSKDKPYKQVESYLADLRYDPETLTLTKKKVKDEIELDNEPYIIVEITNDAVRIQSRRTTKVTEIKWTKSPKGD